MFRMSSTNSSVKNGLFLLFAILSFATGVRAFCTNDGLDDYLLVDAVSNHFFMYATTAQVVSAPNANNQAFVDTADANGRKSSFSLFSDQ